MTTCLNACDDIILSGSVAASIYAIQKVVIIDAEKGVIAPDQTVIGDDSRIKKIAEQSKIDILENAMVIHGHGLYLMPDLVDTHGQYLDAPVFGSLMIVN